MKLIVISIVAWIAGLGSYLAVGWLLWQQRISPGDLRATIFLSLLVVTVSVFLTFAIGARVRRKIQLQAVADTTAFSLAVAEARAFNFYAWSNRAIVAHNVSILSVHAHTTYFSFYEDALAATANNYRLLSRRASGLEAEKLDAVADIYLNSDFDPATGHSWEWYYVEATGDTGRRAETSITASGDVKPIMIKLR